MFHEEQPGYVNMTTLDCVHKGCEATLVSAVWFILAPRAQTQKNRPEKGHCFKPNGQLTLDHLQQMMCLTNDCGKLEPSSSIPISISELNS